jgi:hypothetical protein
MYCFSGDIHYQLLYPQLYLFFPLILFYLYYLTIDGWNWIQAPILKRYPAQLSLTAFTHLIGAVESAVIAVICEYKKSNLWAIGWNIELLSVVYSVTNLNFQQKIIIGIALTTLHMGYNNKILIGINSSIMTNILHVSGSNMFCIGDVLDSLGYKQKRACIRGTFLSTWHYCHCNFGAYHCSCVSSCGQVSQNTGINLQLYCHFISLKRHNTVH